MSVPNWYELVLLSLAAWRIWHLLAQDTILDRPRRYLLRLDAHWEKAGDFEGDNYRLEWAKFLTCPYCAGFWIGLLWWLGFQADEHWALVVSTPFALSAGVVAAHKLLTQDE